MPKDMDLKMRNNALCTLGISLIVLILFIGLSCNSEKNKTPAANEDKVIETPNADSVPSESGYELFNQGRFKLAAIKLAADLKARPKDNDLRLFAGKAAYKAKDFSSTELILTPLVEQKVAGQTEALAWQYLAQSAMESGDKEKAKIIFLKIRTRYKDDPGNLRAMVMHEGNIYWKAGDWDNALNVFKELIEIGDKDQKPGVLLQIALVQRDAGRTEESRKILESIIANYHGQNNVANDARLQLAKYYLKKNNLIKSKEFAYKADKSGADINQISELLLNIARAYEKNKNNEKAEALYIELLDRFSKEMKILNNIRAGLANFYLSNSEKEKATKILKLIAKQSTDDKQKQWAQDSLDELSSR